MTNERSNSVPQAYGAKSPIDYIKPNPNHNHNCISNPDHKPYLCDDTATL